MGTIKLSMWKLNWDDDCNDDNHELSLNETLEQALSEVELMKKIRTEERLKESRELKIQKEMDMFLQLKEGEQEDEGGLLEEVRVKRDEELTKLELKRRKDREKQSKYRMKSEEEEDKQRKYRNLQKMKSEEEKMAEKRENQRMRTRKCRERKKRAEKLAELQARVYFLFYFFGQKILTFYLPVLQY